MSPPEHPIKWFPETRPEPKHESAWPWWVAFLGVGVAWLALLVRWGMIG